MKPTKKPRTGSQTFAFGGGVVGLITFLFVGLLPSLVYGGFAGVSLAAGLLGHSVDGSLLGRALVIFGMVTGLLATAAVFVVVGAAAGAGLYALARTAGRREAERDHDTPERNHSVS